jgi:hypothetical protein
MCALLCVPARSRACPPSHIAVVLRASAHGQSDFTRASNATHLPAMERMDCAVNGDGSAWQAARPRRQVRARIRRMRTRTRPLWPERMPKASRPAPCSKVGGLALSLRPYIYILCINFIYIYVYIYKYIYI